jgi:outer membrane protein assembly factor BamA
VNASLEQGLGGSLRPDPESLMSLDERRVAEFTAAHVDIRRYARLTPYSRLALRILASGTVDGGALPAQRQKTLGGEGSLPGYPLRSLDCGARNTPVTSGQQFFPYHGCDRAALMRLELQSSFPMARKLGEKLRLGNWLTNSVRWSAFVDAGRAWTEESALQGRAPGGDDFSADAGLGLKLGPFGAYWAVPLSGSEHKYNFFIRLGQRL